MATRLKTQALRRNHPLANDPFSEQVYACTGRLWFQMAKAGDPEWHMEPLKRFPRGWRPVMQDWANGHGIALIHAHNLGSYINWMIGRVDVLTLRVLMDEAWTGCMERYNGGAHGQNI